MRSGLEGFESLDEAAAAIAAYTPNRVRKPNPQGLRKNLRLRDGRWYWHWDPEFLRQGDEPTRQADSIVRYERARDAAAAVTVPTMLVRGKQSHVVSEEGAKELLELIPTATADRRHRGRSYGRRRRQRCLQWRIEGISRRRRCRIASLKPSRPRTQPVEGSARICIRVGCIGGRIRLRNRCRPTELFAGDQIGLWPRILHC